MDEYISELFKRHLHTGAWRDILQILEQQLSLPLKRRIIFHCIQALVTENSPERVDSCARSVLEFYEQDISFDEMREVPGSVFFYGDENASRYLAGFTVSRYPISNFEYTMFLKENRQHPVPFVSCSWARLYNWDPASRSYPRGFGAFPVVLISRRDAESFAQWKGARLLSQLEWEKAARGLLGNLYPWGNEFSTECANTRRSRLGFTTPVYLYDQYESPFGVSDLSGNVWEWTMSTETRGAALRGGSFASSALNAQSTFKNSFLPDGRSTAIGFRIAI